MRQLSTTEANQVNGGILPLLVIAAGAALLGGCSSGSSGSQTPAETRQQQLDCAENEALGKPCGPTGG